MPLAIPFTFAGSTVASPPILSRLDTDFSTTASYINARNPAVGTLANRPAAGNDGAIYYATDTATLYLDDGAAWNTVTSSVGVYGIRRLQGANNAANPNTRFDMSADAVALRNTTSGAVTVRTDTGTLTCNLATTGANGLQTGVQAASTWYHFYFIWDGTTLATFASLTAPPTGPTLPSGYTSWAYAGAVRSNGSTQLTTTRWRGALAFIVPVEVRESAAGTGAEQSYDASSDIPPNHLGALLQVTTNDIAVRIEVRYETAGMIVLGGTFGGTAFAAGWSAIVPFAAQTIFFLGAVTATLQIILSGFKMPNGGE